MPEQIIIGCGKQKYSRPLPAQSMYRSTYIRYAVGWSRSVGIEPMILSAKHGLIPGSKIIAPYTASFSMNGFAAEPGVKMEPTMPIHLIARQVESLGVSGSVIMLAGSIYQEVLAAAAPNLIIERPFYDLAHARFGDARQGMQVKLMREFWGRFPVDSPQSSG